MLQILDKIFNLKELNHGINILGSDKFLNLTVIINKLKSIKMIVEKLWLFSLDLVGECKIAGEKITWEFNFLSLIS